MRAGVVSSLSDRRTIHDQIVEAIETLRSVLELSGIDPRYYFDNQAQPTGVPKQNEQGTFLRVVTGGREVFIPAPRIMQLWYCEPCFLDNNGNPRVLPLSGSESFESLLHQAGCDLDVLSVRDAMFSAGLIEAHGHGFLKPLMRVVLGRADVASRQAFYTINDLLRVLEHNLEERPVGGQIFQRFVTESKIPTNRAEEFRRHFEVQAMVFLTSIEEWMTTAEKQSAPGTEMEGMNVHLFLAPLGDSVEGHALAAPIVAADRSGSSSITKGTSSTTDPSAGPVARQK